MIEDWKKLPAYRAEPRVDSLIGYYLDALLSDYLEINIEKTIPELPLRLGTINPEYNNSNFADRSYKVDFFSIGNNGCNYLIEFKTDPHSVRDKQDNYLTLSKTSGTESIINGVLKIADASTYKNKYKHLINKLKEVSLIDQELKYTGKNPICDIIYIIPVNNGKNRNTIDFKYVANWLESTESIDVFEKALIETLRHWYCDYSKGSNCL